MIMYLQMPVYTTTFCIRIFYWCGGIVAIAGATCVHLWSTTCSLLFYHVADSLELTLQDYFNTFYILTLFWTSYMRLHALLKKKVHSKRVELLMWTSFAKNRNTQMPTPPWHNTWIWSLPYRFQPLHHKFGTSCDIFLFTTFMPF